MLAQAAGLSVAATRNSCSAKQIRHPFVTVEQMMPLLPFVAAAMWMRVSPWETFEHGFRHTYLFEQCCEYDQDGQSIGCRNLREEWALHGRVGLGKRGYPPFSIAGPTGEGLHSPTFTREHRMLTHRQHMCWDDEENSMQVASVIGQP